MVAGGEAPQVLMNKSNKFTFKCGGNKKNIHFTLCTSSHLLKTRRRVECGTMDAAHLQRPPSWLRGRREQRFQTCENGGWGHDSTSHETGNTQENKTLILSQVKVSEAATGYSDTVTWCDRHFLFTQRPCLIWDSSTLFKCRVTAVSALCTSLSVSQNTSPWRLENILPEKNKKHLKTKEHRISSNNTADVFSLTLVRFLDKYTHSSNCHKLESWFHQKGISQADPQQHRYCLYILFYVQYM